MNIQPSLFEAHFIGQEVILVNNDGEFGAKGMVRATISGYTFTCRNNDVPVAIYANANGKFMFGGAVLPWNQLTWDFLLPLEVMTRWELVRELSTFSHDLHYAVRLLTPVEPKIPQVVVPPAPKPFWKRILRMS